MPKDENESDKKIPVAVTPVNRFGLKREFINYAHINHSETEFSIDLCDVDPDLLKDIQDINNPVLEVPIKARFVCTPDFITRFSDALRDNLEKYSKGKK